MEPYQPLDDAQKRLHGKLAGLRGGGFAEIIIYPRPRRRKTSPNLSQKEQRKLNELLDRLQSRNGHGNKNPRALSSARG